MKHCACLRGHKLWWRNNGNEIIFQLHIDNPFPPRRWDTWGANRWTRLHLGRTNTFSVQYYHRRNTFSTTRQISISEIFPNLVRSVFYNKDVFWIQSENIWKTYAFNWISFIICQKNYHIRNQFQNSRNLSQIQRCKKYVS